MDYIKLTTDQLIQQFKSRIDGTNSFGVIENSKIFEKFMEFMTDCCDNINFYTQRIAEESDITSAKTESNMIKHCHNRGYHPRRPIPAQAELIIKLKGPFPEELNQAGTEIFFNQALTDLTYNGFKFKLDSSYSYVLSQEDIDYCHDADWEKQLIAAVPHNNSVYLPLQGVNFINDTNSTEIKCFQGELKTYTINGSSVINKLGKPRQVYKIPDETFSNWYGTRDPYAYRGARNYVQKNSWCKIGIGATEEDAFQDDALFDVETLSILLNKQYQKLKKKTYGNTENVYDVVTFSDYLDLKYDDYNNKSGIEPTLRICSITSNPDRSVRITFGNDSAVINGLMTTDENLYVQYISTSGRAANQQGITGNIITHNNPIYASVNGNIIDITANIEFILNSDIYGGDDFETIESMRINAPAYFSSQNKLIMLEDFQNYFRTLTTPMLVNTAYVQGQQRIENYNEHFLPFTQNTICYTLLGRLYLQNAGDYYPRNILTGTDNSSEPYSLYSTDYLAHLCDRLKFMLSPIGYKYQQYKKSATEPWVKYAQLIRENCKDNLPFNTTILSMPPMVHYFDLVGTVNVKPTTNLQEYNTRLKNKIYKFLDIQSKTTPDIYKSDLIKLYADDPDTLNVDIDIKLSTIIKSAESNFIWGSLSSTNSWIKATSSLILDETLPTWENILPESISDSRKNRCFNMIKLPLYDDTGKLLTETFINKSRIKFDISYKTSNELIWTSTLNCTAVIGLDPDDGKDYIYITLPCTAESQSKIQDNIIVSITAKSENDFVSTSQFSHTRVEDYKLPGGTDEFNGIQADLTNWLKSINRSRSVNRAITLPYTVPITKDPNSFARKETIMRKSEGLTEHSFWTEFAPNLLKTYYVKTNSNGKTEELLTNDTYVDSEIWNGAAMLIYDIYTLIKPGLSDSLLDDNNNIVNFSMRGCEAAVIINKVNIIQN